MPQVHRKRGEPNRIFLGCIFFRSKMTIESNTQTFFDISIDAKPAGRICFELFTEVVPKTTKNFIELCSGFTDSDGQLLSYKNSGFHRVIKKFMLQGGGMIQNDF